MISIFAWDTKASPVTDSGREDREQAQDLFQKLSEETWKLGCVTTNQCKEIIGQYVLCQGAAEADARLQFRSVISSIANEINIHLN